MIAVVAVVAASGAARAQSREPAVPRLSGPAVPRLSDASPFARDSTGACGGESAPLLAPARAGVRATGLDETRAVCARGGASAGVRALAQGDDIRWIGLARVALASAAGVELGMGARVAAWGAGDDASFGPAWIEVAHATDHRWLGVPATAAPSLRLELPRTDSAADDATVVAAAPAYQVAFAAGERLRVHARAGALLWAALFDDTVETRAALLAGADASALLTSWLALSAGAEVQGGWHDGGLDHLLVRAAARAGGGGWALELAAAAPAVGDEPGDLVLGLSLAHWR